MWFKKNLQLAEAQIVGLQCACLHVHNMKGCDGFKLLQNIYIYPIKPWKLPKCVAFKISKTFPFPQKMPENFRKILTPESSNPKAEGCVTWRWKEEVDKKSRVASVWHQLFYWERPGYVHRTVTSFNCDEFARSPLWMKQDCSHRSWGFYRIVR